MAYFNESYQKIFIGTKATTANGNQVTGFIITAGLPTKTLNTNTGVAATTYGLGSWGLFNPTTWNSVTTASLGTTAPRLVLAAAPVQTVDTVGQFAGGYMETNKGKEIDPRYINRFVRIDTCTPRNQTIHVGSTKYTRTLSPTNGDCTFDFLCGETYTLRIEIKNDPVYHLLGHSGIRLLSYNTGCCPVDDPTAVIDGTLVMIDWANQIVNDPILKNFISPIVYSEAGDPYYPPNNAAGSTPTWDHYTPPGHTAGRYAGLRLQGAYVNTTFGNCSFYPTDWYNQVPVQTYISMVDFNGDPCAFTGICVQEECGILEGNGLGETVLRDLILSEKYRQNPFPDDNRLREILLGSDTLAAVTRGTLYTRYLIQYTIPRPNNPAGTYSPDQYTDQIITNGTVAAFETLMAAWLSNAKNPVSLETFSCGTCTPLSP